MHASPGLGFAAILGIARLPLYICIFSASIAFHGFSFSVISSLLFFLASNLVAFKQGRNGSSNPGLRSETLFSRVWELQKGVRWAIPGVEKNLRTGPLFYETELL